jgi:peptidoglycan/LPS O-acetylase OafA/YrhL
VWLAPSHDAGKPYIHDTAGGRPYVSMKQRLAYLDNLKILLVVGVVALHTAITYGFDGSWYLESYDEMTGAVVDALTVVLGTGWLFGLGLFFLIAGRLTGPSLDRKGPGRFAGTVSSGSGSPSSPTRS